MCGQKLSRVDDELERITGPFLRQQILIATLDLDGNGKERDADLTLSQLVGGQMVDDGERAEREQREREWECEREVRLVVDYLLMKVEAKVEDDRKEEAKKKQDLAKKVSALMPSSPVIVGMNALTLCSDDV